MSQGVDTRLCLPKTAWPPTCEMDYTKNEELMEIIQNAAREIEGLKYSYRTLNTDWTKDERIIRERKENTNRAIEKVKEYFDESIG